MGQILNGKQTIQTDTINENTVGAGITVDGCLIKDGSTNNNYVQTILATNVTGTGADITVASQATITVPSTGIYELNWWVQWDSTCTTGAAATISIRNGATFSSATTLQSAYNQYSVAVNSYNKDCGSFIVTEGLTAGDTIHLGIGIARRATNGDCHIYKEVAVAGDRATGFNIKRIG